MDDEKRILIVDDEPGVLKILSANLTAAGYKVFITTTGKEALNLVKKAKLDIMLLDLFMAPWSGFDVLKKLRKSSDLPVIVFSARNDIGTRAIKEGANGYIGKPVMPEKLIEKIEETLKSYQLQIR